MTQWPYQPPEWPDDEFHDALRDVVRRNRRLTISLYVTISALLVAVILLALYACL